MGVYFDSSALVKFAIDEPESSALRTFAGRRPEQYSCDLIRTELVRAARRHSAAALDLAHDVLGSLVVIRLDEAILARAGMVDPATVRSLDAIHLAAALTLGDELEAVVTYDGRMADAARGLGLRVEQPA